MSNAEQPDYVTAETYLAAKQLAVTKREYIDGWVRAMPGATNRHNSVKMNCALHLGPQLTGKRCRPFDSDTKVRIRQQASTRYYYPDLQVVCDGNLPTEVYQDRPVLIIEVLSPSTRAYDLDEKMNAYLQIPSLDCYVALEQHIPFAILMRRTPGGFLRETYEGVDTKIDMPLIECVLPLGDIYDGIEFTPTCVQETEEAYSR